MGYLATSFLREEETEDVGTREGFPWRHRAHERPASAASRSAAGPHSTPCGKKAGPGPVL